MLRKDIIVIYLGIFILTLVIILSFFRKKVALFCSLCIEKIDGLLAQAEEKTVEAYTRIKMEEELSKIEKEVKRKIENFSFHSVFEPMQDDLDWPDVNIPRMSVSEAQIKFMLSNKSLNGPCGVNLLKLLNIGYLPTFPNLQNINNGNYDQRIKKIQKLIEDVRSKPLAEIEKANKLKEAYNMNQQSAIEEVVRLTLLRHAVPEIFQKKIDILYEAESRIILVVLEIPDLSSISIVKRKAARYFGDWIEVSAKVQKKLKEDILYSLCIRAGYLVAKSDTKNFDLVAINAKQSWFDPATGVKKEGIIASLQASKEDFLSLQIDRIEPKACFRYLKGVSTPSVENIMAIKPIFDLNMNDRRIIEGRNVSDSLDPNANLAEMPWDDFEHLVRQLFEWEFGNKGIEVKVTCASRDRGVDAIMFDPDPLKGGKYVLQAKRYTRTVDVAAVRDLYGTVVNEGANRGILVTTSSYGPDTYEFAKDKPISLVDGQHLVQMLKKHGKNYHIQFER